MSQRETPRSVGRRAGTLLARCPDISTPGENAMCGSEENCGSEAPMKCVLCDGDVFGTQWLLVPFDGPLSGQANPWHAECLNDMLERGERLNDVDYQRSLLKKDLQEWTETFAPYGCEPQACLATLNLQKASLMEASWGAIWQALCQTGMRATEGAGTCLEQAIRHIEYLYAQATKPPQVVETPKPVGFEHIVFAEPKPRGLRLKPESPAFGDFEKGMMISNLQSIRHLLDDLEGRFPW